MLSSGAVVPLRALTRQQHGRREAAARTVAVLAVAQVQGGSGERVSDRTSSVEKPMSPMLAVASALERKRSWVRCEGAAEVGGRMCIMYTCMRMSCYPSHANAIACELLFLFCSRPLVRY